MVLLICFILGFIAWFISTIAAGGAATLLMPILAYSDWAYATAPIITLAAIVANPTRAITFRKHIHWPIAKRLILGSVIGAFIGASLFVQLPVFRVKLLIAIFLISTIFQYRFGRKAISFDLPHWLLTPISAIVAFVSGLIGGSGPVLNTFLLNAGLQKEQLIATKAINSLIMQIAKLLTYGIIGVISFEIGTLGIAIGLGGAASIFLAKHYLARIDHQRFHQYTLILMFFAGVLMLINLLKTLL